MGYVNCVNAESSLDLGNKLRIIHQTNTANPHRVLSLFFSMMD
jgi:hypothetical protein